VTMIPKADDMRLHGVIPFFLRRDHEGRAGPLSDRGSAQLLERMPANYQVTTKRRASFVQDGPALRGA